MFSDSIALRRRTVINIFGAIVAKTFSLSGLIYALDAHKISVEEVSLPIPKLPTALNGTRFVQISDLHMGPHFGAENLFPIVAKINALQPEFVIITGDYTNDQHGRVDEMLAPLSGLEAPTYGVLGNHDAWGHTWSIERILQQASIQLLWNQSVEVKPQLWLVGLDDVLLGRPNLRRALADTPINATRLLMVHEPDYFMKTVDAKVPVAAQFSGHTHGGQVRLPSFNRTGSGHRPYILPTMGKKYVMGLYQVGDQMVYVNRGLGFTGPPLRLNCRPEITVFTLTNR